jgi:hypothetical protein
MEFFADLLIAAGAIGLAVFCFVLSRRLKALGRLDSGIGGAIAVLAAQVDDLTRALKAAQATARATASQLESQTERADTACRQLELLMASLHDLPPPRSERPTAQAARKSKADTDTPPVESRPLARWNSNRLQADRDPEPARTEAPASRARTFEPVEKPAKRARARVVRRKQGVGARA